MERAISRPCELGELADQVVGECPPADQAHVVEPALACDPEHVPVSRLTQALVRPDDHGVAAVEVADPPPAGLSRAVLPRSLASPAEGRALAGVALHSRALELRLVSRPHRPPPPADRAPPAPRAE